MNELVDLIEWYISVRKQTSDITILLKTEDYLVQPMEDVSPPKWHLAHTTWFFEAFVLPKVFKNYKPYKDSFNYLFNSYYESAGKRLPRNQRGMLSRPTIDMVMDYRDHVDIHMHRLVNEDMEIDQDVKDMIILGINHEQQHQELLFADIKYILGSNPLFPAYMRDLEQAVMEEAVVNDKFTAFEEGIYEIGNDGKSFCFDNELERHKVYLYPFEIQNRLVTNGEYLEFMDAGGYENFELWLSEGWDWLNENHVKAPLYWHKKDSDWKYFTLHGTRDIDLHAPVCHINYFEADAYANWKGCRLPTEAEWEVACNKLQPVIEGNFMESNHLMPIPVLENNLQFFGDVWEWTSSPYLPYPYFKKAPGTVGEYNGKFMVNQKVLRGGSCITPLEHIRPTYRNYFHTEKRWQFTGLRLARSK